MPRTTSQPCAPAAGPAVRGFQHGGAVGPALHLCVREQPLRWVAAGQRCAPQQHPAWARRVAACPKAATTLPLSPSATCRRLHRLRQAWAPPSGAPPRAPHTTPVATTCPACGCAAPAAKHKHSRALLPLSTMLLACSACGATWRQAYGAAAGCAASFSLQRAALDRWHAEGEGTRRAYSRFSRTRRSATAWTCWRCARPLPLQRGTRWTQVRGREAATGHGAVSRGEPKCVARHAGAPLQRQHGRHQRSQAPCGLGLSSQCGTAPPTPYSGIMITVQAP